jgi:hypothetical protein
MKKFIVAVLIAAATSAAHAQIYGGYGNRGFGGYNPPVTTRPNIFGGYDIQQGFNGPRIQTRPNIFGGYDIDRGFNQPRVSCRPNIFGGVDCR